MLEHDHGVVHHEPDDRGEAAERHHVEAHAHDEEHKARCGEHRRQHERGNQHEASGSEKEEKHQPGKRGPDQDRIADGVRGSRDKLGLVVIRRRDHARRQARRLHPFGRRPHDRHRVAKRRLANVDKHGLAAVRRDAREDWCLGGANGADLTERHKSCAGLIADPQRCRCDLCKIGDAIFDEHKVEAMAILELADSAHAVGFAERRRDVGHAETKRLQTPRIDIDRELTRGPAKDIDAGDARDSAQSRQHLLLGKSTQRRRIEAGRCQRIADHGKQRRIGATDGEPRIRRQIGEDHGQLTLRRQGGRHDIVAPGEIECDFRRTPAGRRPNARDPGDRPERDLDGSCDLGGHLRRVAVAGIDRYDDARVVEVRKQPDRQPRRRHQPRQRQQNYREPDRAAVRCEEPVQRVRTFIPSSIAVPPATTTASAPLSPLRIATC